MHVESLDLKRRVALNNQITYILIAASSAYIGIFCLFGKVVIGLSLIPVEICFVFSLFLSRLKLYTLSRWGTFFTANVATFIYASSFGQDAGTQFLFFAFIGIPLVVFCHDEIFPIILSIIIPIFGFFALYFTNFSLIPSSNLDDFQKQCVFYTISIVTFLISILYIRFMLTSSRKFESDLIHKNTELTDAYIELKKNKLTIEKLQQQTAFANLTKGIAHEIRNPFAILQSSMELLIDRRNNESEAQELVERIKVGIKRILKIIQVMLKYGGAAAKEKETLDVNAFLEDFLSMAVRKYEREGITFEVDLGVLPPLFGDPTALYQIIGNLVQNAQEAITEAKREAGLIHIKTEPKSRLFEDLSIEGVELSVCDNGIGISDDVRLQIYDAFFSTKYGNQGLGLSVVLNLIKDHNGLIDVESKAGHGTTFRVWLPLDSQCLVN